MKIVIVATHPIQYQVPWFQRLAARDGIQLKVLFAMLPTQEQQGVGFNVAFAWDIPLLEGYEWEVLESGQSTQDLTSFGGTNAPTIQRTLAANQPDVVIITGWHARPLLQALWACMRLGIPRMVRGEANAMRQRSWKARLAHRLLLSRFDAALTIGRSSREFYRQNGVPDDRLFSTPYFVDNQRFARQAEAIAPERSRIRAEWDIPERAACYVYVGKLEEKKRILDLLAALAIAREAAPHLHLLVVGTGVLMDEAKRLAGERNLPVTFAGFLNQTAISRAYVAGDCLVLPSDYGETWGLVVNEAMASGLPAIVSDRVGCGPDLVEDGVTGATFPFGDIGALADRLVRYADRAALSAMGRHARERIAAYSVERAVDGTVAAARHVVRSPGAKRT